MNKNELIEFVMNKLNERNDLTDDQRQDLLLECLEYINKTQSKNPKIRLYEIIRTEFEEENKLLNIDDVNLAYEIKINEEKILVDFIMKNLGRIYPINNNRFIRVLKARYFEGKTYIKIGEEFGVTPECIRQIDMKGIRICKAIALKKPLMFVGTSCEKYVARVLEKSQNTEEEKEVNKQTIKITIVRKVDLMQKKEDIKIIPKIEENLNEKPYIIDFYKKHYDAKLIDERLQNKK